MNEKIYICKTTEAYHTIKNSKVHNELHIYFENLFQLQSNLRLGAINHNPWSFAITTLV